MTTTTKTTASVYQQLRNHLVDLKLADAADAYPPCSTRRPRKAGH